MADTKLTALSALSPILSTDILYCVSDPGGTPASKKLTVLQLLTAARFTTSLLDTNGKPLIAITPTASAVYGLTLVNAALLGTVAIGVTTPSQVADAVAGTPLSITAQAAVAGSANAGAAAGGEITITSGAAARLTSGNANGGNINLTCGAGIGTGAQGIVLVTALGISNPGAGAGSERFGAAAVASGAGSTVIGSAATAGSNTNCVVVGDTASATGTVAVSIGHGALAAAGQVSIGNAATGSGTANGVAIGNSSVSNGNIAIGQAASGGGASNVVLGTSCVASGSGSILIGSALVDSGVANTLIIGGFFKNLAGVAQLGDGTAVGNLGKLLAGRVVTPKTGDYTVVTADKHTFFTNTGASGTVIFTLPTAVAGLTYEFYRDANQTIQIVAGASTTIRVGATATAAAGNVTLDAVGSRIRLVAISTTQWVGDLTGTATFT